MSFGSVALPARVLLLIATAFFLAGCPAPPKEPPRVTPLTGSFTPPPAEQSENIAVTAEPSVQLPRDVNDPVLPEEQLQIPTGLLSLNTWAQLCGFHEVRALPGVTPYTVQLQGLNGDLTLTFGNRFAKWNGINLGLGFVPGVKQGQLVVHSIDVLKSFYPLSLGTFTIAKPSRVLVLDPGHGGSDPGSLSSGKTHEKHLTLDWALRVEKLLAGSSWRVVLTRREDRDLSLLERVAIADANNADVFISLHFNSLERTPSGREESGIETYCLAPAGAPSHTVRNYEDDSRRLYPNNSYDAENLLLAMRLQESLVKTTKRRDRGVRRARFMTVIREQKRPAVLIEGGFLSNAVEERLILDGGYRQQMAQAVCNALPN